MKQYLLNDLLAWAAEQAADAEAEAAEAKAEAMAEAKAEAEAEVVARRWLADPANRADANYSDIFKDVWGIRPRW